MRYRDVASRGFGDDPGNDSDRHQRSAGSGAGAGGADILPIAQIADTVERCEGGFVYGRGPVMEGMTHGHWTWRRQDGTLMLSVFLYLGEAVGEWATHHRAGADFATVSRTAGSSRRMVADLSQAAIREKPGPRYEGQRHSDA